MSMENQSECVKVRISHSLSEGEKNHVTSRRESAQKCLERHGIQCSLEQVPSIVLLGSGGSERAMVGLLGSLVSLSQDDLLDCMLYLAGISGSTWCMASLYKEPEWSNKLEEVKDDIKKRLLGSAVRFKDKISKLTKYYRQKDNFSLTDVWAVLFISKFLKEIDGSSFTSQHRSHHSKDPYPIYTVIDIQSQKHKLKADMFVEITPHETGYCIPGAFVESSGFGSQFDQGLQIKDQPEMDMLFLQGLCGSCLADRETTLEELLKLIKDLIFPELGTTNVLPSSDFKLNALVELNLHVLTEKDISSQVKTLKELLRGKLDKTEYEKLSTFKSLTKGVAKEKVQEYTLYICEHQSDWDQSCCDIWTVIAKCIDLVVHWIWGTTYNFLYNMSAKEVSHSILKNKKRPFADAGITDNSPYLPVLRKERNIDLIISLDFSEGDPFETVITTANMCKELNIDFPGVHEEELEKEKSAPKDFYVFEGDNVPTVIHIPLFNKVNCGKDIPEWNQKYKTFQGPYDKEDKIDNLLDKAGMNIRNNKEKLLTEIQKVIQRKTP